MPATVKVTFLPVGGHFDGHQPEPLSVEVEPGTTILRAAQKAHAKVGFACGGNCACSTCHVYVRQGFDSLADMSDTEEDILDKAFDVKAQSRLGCQSKVGKEDLVVELTRESRAAWYDEHPDARALLPPGTPR
jgi:2Fe-2S ferredoxin